MFNISPAPAALAKRANKAFSSATGMFSRLRPPLGLRLSALSPPWSYAMWARFTVLRDTPIDSAIAGCVIPFSRSNTIWMRWRCWGCPFQRSAVFKRRISFLVHLTTCSSESNQIRWSVRIILRLTNAIHIRIRCFATINIRFNQLWKRYHFRVPGSGFSRKRKLKSLNLGKAGLPRRC